jgi:CRP-like cAMP-binding protein
MGFEHLLSDVGQEEREPQRSEIIGILKKTQFFNDLDEEELDAVSKCIVEKSFRAGEVIIAEGIPGENFYLVKKGKVSVEKKSGDRSMPLARLADGECFGELSLIDNSPTSATVRAVEDSDLMLIGRLDLNVLLNWNTILAAKMWRAFTEMLSLRIRDSNERLLDVVQKVRDIPEERLSRDLITRTLGIGEEG